MLPAPYELREAWKIVNPSSSAGCRAFIALSSFNTQSIRPYIDVAKPGGIRPSSIFPQMIGSAFLGKEMLLPSRPNISGEVNGQKSFTQSSRKVPFMNVTRLSLAKYSPLFLLLSAASHAKKDVKRFTFEGVRRYHLRSTPGFSTTIAYWVISEIVMENKAQLGLPRLVKPRAPGALTVLNLRTVYVSYGIGAPTLATVCTGPAGAGRFDGYEPLSTLCGP